MYEKISSMRCSPDGTRWFVLREDDPKHQTISEYQLTSSDPLFSKKTLVRTLDVKDFPVAEGIREWRTEDQSMKSITQY